MREKKEELRRESLQREKERSKKEIHREGRVGEKQRTERKFDLGGEK